MPLHVARLRDSDLAGEESAEACWYAVLLWAASWHQIPAASLPNNEAILTKLLGLGKDVRTFRKHRAAALRGFIKCDDGRLYHPVVAEQALTAWDGKLHQRWRTECARIKKQNQRTESNDLLPTFDEFMQASGFHVLDPGPACVPGDIAKCPSGNEVQEKGIGKEIPLVGVVSAGANDPDDWPEGKATDHAKLLSAIDPHLDPAKCQGLVTSLGEVARWRQIGASWDLDIIPAVVHRASRRNAPTAATWKFFSPAIERSLADRNRPSAPIDLEHPHERARTTTPRQAAFVGGLSDIDRAMAEACERPPGRP
jgi:hypothetical protein